MLPILLVHGYSTEGKDATVEEIYGNLPDELRRRYGQNKVIDLNLSRWISLNDGLTIDDISFAMDRALKESYSELLTNGFNVIIHSTGALVVRNWIKKFSSKPSPVHNFIHLAGANFGSGLAHIGSGQMARWGRLLMGTGRGIQVLEELEFGSSKTLDLHLYFNQPGSSMFTSYQVQEFCLVGSQTLSILRPIPIRYVKEDSSDNTVRTSAANLNFNYVSIQPRASGSGLSAQDIQSLIETRLNDEEISDDHYQVKISRVSQSRPRIPYAILFETAHFGDDIGIVSGKDNRDEVMPLLMMALDSPYNAETYAETERYYEQHHQQTLLKAAALKSNLLEWNKQQQYEAHAQVIFRLRDQYGNDVTNFDINIKSDAQTSKRRKHSLEQMIEHNHINRKHRGIMTFYLRTQRFNKGRKSWTDRLKNIEAANIEITGVEPQTNEISYLPVNFRIEPRQLRRIVRSFETTVIDIQLIRLPSARVFEIKAV